MSPTRQWIIGAVAFGAMCQAEASARTHPQSAPEGVTFRSALDLKQQPTGLEPQLRGGIVAVSKDWPASLYATFDTPQGRASCTAALVGPRALATAGHCVPASGKVQFDFSNKIYSAQCVRHPDYVSRKDASADYALCQVTTAFQPPAGFLYEKFDTAPMASLVGSGVILTGFGCTTDTGGGFDGKYRIGINTIAETSQSPGQELGAAYYVPNESNNLFTAKPGANLCPGDSGGAAFRLVTGPRKGDFANRAIIGINSRVFYADASAITYSSSLVSAVGTSAFIDWALKWARDNELEVCGLHGTPAGCR